MQSSRHAPSVSGEEQEPTIRDQLNTDLQAHKRRILQLSVLVSAFFCAILFVLVLITNGMSEAPITLSVLGTMALLCGLVWALAQRWYIAAGTHLFFGTLIAGALLTSLPVGLISQSIPTLFLPIVGATLLLRPRWSFVYAGLALATYLIIYLADLATSSDSFDVTLIIVYGAYFFITALFAYLAAQQLSGALATSQQNAEQLALLRDNLEIEVAQRTAELQSALAEVQQFATQQSQLLEENQRQGEAIRELSVPVLPIGTHTLMMPLVGALDAARLQQISERALQSIGQIAAKKLLLDITGVPVVDTQVAQGLIGVIQAARLMGTEVILVGIRPEVAQAIVGSGIELNDVATRATLQSGIEYAVGR